ncbi:MAG: hypothetical protein ACOYNO_07540, partial [Saprospiraceae bacterium]
CQLHGSRNALGNAVVLEKMLAVRFFCAHLDGHQDRIIVGKVIANIQELGWFKKYGQIHPTILQWMVSLPKKTFCYEM